VGVNIEPAIAGWLGIALAAGIVACAGAVLRVVAVCRFHIERLERLQEDERRLEAVRASLLSQKAASGGKG